LAANRLYICHVMSFHSQQRPNDNRKALAMTKKVLDRKFG
jgi:hypothetical protein